VKEELESQLDEDMDKMQTNLKKKKWVNKSIIVEQDRRLDENKKSYSKMVK
jgi:hypothetical protein